MLRVAAISVLLLALGACGSVDVTTTEGPGTEDSPPPPPPTPAAVTVRPPALAASQLEAMVPLVATVLDGAGNELTAQTVEWSTSDPSVVQISPAGLATVIGVGAATIEARVGTAAGEVPVEVFEAAAAPSLQFTYLSPSRSSDEEDQERYEAVLDSLISDPTFGWIDQGQRDRYAQELDQLRSGARSFRY